MLVALLTESVDRNKCCGISAVGNVSRRSPHGERGSKFCIIAKLKIVKLSLSSRRAWIEIQMYSHTSYTVKSLSSRRAWIEIPVTSIVGGSFSVALLAESVDRNLCEVPLHRPFYVALLTESVDRNLCLLFLSACKIGRSPHGERGSKYKCTHIRRTR